MQFHLNINTGVSTDKIEHRNITLFFGSCFSEHIEKRLNDLKFNSASNPFGIVFNPVSIQRSLNRIITKTYFTENDLLENGDMWKCLETHSSLSMASKAQLLHTLNSLVDEWYVKLCKANTLIITFGSAFFYEHLESGITVANCHKLPGKLFTKHLSNTAAIVADYNALLNTLKSFNPDLKVIFTVSPVKHLRDGIIENSLSKAVLIQSVHEISKQHSNCTYFPAYELVNDDLRDYRFYEADMAHPNKLAIDYVCDKFSGMFFSTDTLKLNAKLRELNSAFHHRPLNKESIAFTEFKQAQVNKCLALKTDYPFLNFDKELIYFSE